MNPVMAPGMTLGGSYAAGDGYIDPPTNVLAYTAALVTSHVRVHEHTTFTGLTTHHGTVAGVQDAGATMVFTGRRHFRH